MEGEGDSLAQAGACSRASPLCGAALLYFFEYLLVFVLFVCFREKYLIVWFSRHVGSLGF